MKILFLSIFLLAGCGENGVTLINPEQEDIENAGRYLSQFQGPSSIVILNEDKTHRKTIVFPDGL